MKKAKDEQKEEKRKGFIPEVIKLKKVVFG